MKMRIPALILALFLFVAAQTQAQQLAEFIPANASMVMKMSPKNLNNKISFDKLKAFDFYKQSMSGMMMMMPPAVADAINSPSTTGVDAMANYYMFMEENEEANYFNFLMKMNDQKVFEKFFSEQIGVEAQNKGRYSVMANEDMVITFNGKMALFSAIEPKEGSYGAIEEVEDNWGIDPPREVAPPVMEETVPEPPVAIAPPPPPPPVREMEIEEEPVFEDQDIDVDTEADMSDFQEMMEQMQREQEAIAKRKAEASLKAVDGYIGNLMGKKGGTIVSNPSFVKSMASANDMTIWMNYESFQKMQMDNMDPFTRGMMANMAGMYKDTYMDFGFNFNNGSFDMTSEYFMGPEMKKTFGSLDKVTPNKKFGKYIAGEDLLGFWSMGLDLKGLTQTMGQQFMGAGADPAQMGADFLLSMGINIDKDGLNNLLKGDAVFAVTGVNQVKTMVTDYEYDEDFNRTEVQREEMQTLPEFVMMMSYSNQDDINKFISAGTDNAMLSDQGGFFNIQGPGMPFDVHLATNKGILIVTNNKTLVTDRLKKGLKRKDRMSKKQCKEMIANSQALFWDLDKTFDVVERMGYADDPMMKKVLSASKETFSNFKMTAKENAAGNFMTKASFNFDNKSMNSLEQFFSYFNEMYFHAMGGQSM